VESAARTYGMPPVVVGSRRFVKKWVVQVSSAWLQICCFGSPTSALSNQTKSQVDRGSSDPSRIQSNNFSRSDSLST
jgi:hypothetical protein